MKTVTVSQVNYYIQDLLRDSSSLQNLYVEGEVSNLKYHSSGHVYFTLKDRTAAVSAVMFRSDVRTGLTFPMKDGDKVVVHGRIDVYTARGQYQLYAKDIKPAGQGDLYLRFEQLKKELSEMGMFDEMYKKPIPKYAKTIGIVTAPTGAAVRDIIQISRRRNPYVQLILYPALVQGDGAKESIVRGIQTLDAMGLDLLIVGRGGGSLEDLWAFNEKEVAYAIFQAETPVISAVGHEVDFTIADFVSDLRAPTPSAAAELAVTESSETDRKLAEAFSGLQTRMGQALDQARERADRYQERLRFRSPENLLNERRQYLMDAEDRLKNRMTGKLEKTWMRLERYRRLPELMQQKITDRKHQLSIFAQRLEGRSPLKRLQDGFAYPADDKGEHIRSIKDVKPGDHFSMQLLDGRVLATADAVEGNAPENTEP